MGSCYRTNLDPHLSAKWADRYGAPGDFTFIRFNPVVSNFGYGPTIIRFLNSYW